MDEHLEVPVSSHLRDPHPAVAGLRDDKRHFPLTGSARARALRILQALSQSAESRGWVVKAIEYGRNVYEHRGSNDHLQVETGATRVRIRVFQQTDRAPHTPTARELDELKRWGTRPPKYDHTPNELLRIELDSSWNGNQHSWSEGKRGPIEAKLGSIIVEIERRHAAAAERQAQMEAQETERRSQQQVAIEVARQMLRESNRAEVLARQVSAWQYAKQLGQYIAAMQEAVEHVQDPADRDAGLDWVDWARRHAEEIDPLRRALRVPDDPAPTAEALAPFLRQLGSRG